MEELMTKLGAWLEALPEAGSAAGVLRFVFPLLALAIVVRCAASLLMFRREPEVWAAGDALGEFARPRTRLRRDAGLPDNFADARGSDALRRRELVDF